MSKMFGGAGYNNGGWVMPRLVRLGVALTLVAGILGTVLTVLTSSPAAAAGNATVACSSGHPGVTTTTTTTTFVSAVNNTFTVECYEETATASDPAYPTISVNTPTALDPNATFAGGAPSSTTCAAGVNASTTTTSGSGTTEEYITECNITSSPPVGYTTAGATTFTVAATQDRGQYPDVAAQLHLGDPGSQLRRAQYSHLY